MKKILSLILLLSGTFAMAQVDYTPTYTGARTRSERKITAISLQSPSYPTHAANSLSLSSTEQSQCYVDKTADVTMKVGAGESIAISTSIAGTWMHSYVYIDKDADGFSASIAAGSNYQPEGDLMSYSFYNNDSSSDASGWNSIGASISGDNRNTLALPSFAAPSVQGTYRMRIKIDWCNIDPKGDSDGKFDDFMQNGGHIVDVMLEVAEVSETAHKIFSTTTIEENEFARNTVWYTLQIGANGFVIDNHESANYITLENYISDATNEAHLWAFTGDNTAGYRLYNKQAGTGKVLAAPTTMSGTTGANSYPILVDAEQVPAGYTDLWIFTPSDDLNNDDGAYYYMAEKDYPNNKVNNRDSKLAFWTGGADAGSTLNIRFARAEYPINTLNGEWTASNSEKTWASTWQSKAEPHVSLSVATNNMASYNDNGDIQLFTCLANVAVNGVHSSVYTISADEGYSIAEYRLKFVSSDANNNITITPENKNGVSANSTEAQSINIAADEETNSLLFTVSASSNIFANTSEFYATIVRSSTPVEPSEEIFVYKPGGVCYRIPAIATAYNGDLIAVADYRHSGNDIGMVPNGRIDLHARVSNDNGNTWNEKFAIVEGQGANSKDFMHVGFGDPCIVADRESNRVLVLSCAGNVSFPSGTRDNHQNIARFYSEDNGATWSEPEDIADPIYAMFDNSANHGPVMAMFIGSGKIHQSRYVKVDKYYRLYCAVLLKNRNATYTNFVLYSDDFGGNWNVLGGVETAPIPNGADEPKVEELPNGNIIISSRCNGGRHFNIFTFTNAEKAEGSWGTRATSNSSVKGVVAIDNSCNGEIMILPVVKTEDNSEMWLALQSLPFGSGRTNVGIYYKELASESDYDTPANFAKDWDGRHQASHIGSAYSTMCLQKDNTIAFLYEESTYGRDYTIMYKNYTVEDITDGAYSLDWSRLVSSTNSLVPRTVTPDTDSDVEELSTIELTFNEDIILDVSKKIVLTLNGTTEEIEIETAVSADNAKVLQISVKKNLEIGEYELQIEEGALKTANDKYNPTLRYVFNVNYAVDTFMPTSITPSDRSVLESLKTITLDYTPDYPGRVVYTSVISVTNEDNEEVATGVVAFNSVSYYAVDINLNSEITENGIYTVTIPEGAIWNSKYSGGVANGGRYNAEIVLTYTIDNKTGISNIENDNNETVIYDLTGRRVENPTNGIYIINNKKVLIK